MVMRLLLISLCFLVPAFTISGQEYLDAAAAKKHINESAIVCGYAADVVYLKKRAAININRRYPHEDISLIIWTDDLPAFKREFGRLDNLKHKNICASGKIEVYKNHLQIKLVNPDALFVR